MLSFPPYSTHQLAPNILSTLSGIGSLCVIGGVFSLEIWPTLFGAVVVYLSKRWFLDRMVWLYQDMKDATPEYTGWMYGSDA